MSPKGLNYKTKVPLSHFPGHDLSKDPEASVPGHHQEDALLLHTSQAGVEWVVLKFQLHKSLNTGGAMFLATLCL